MDWCLEGDKVKPPSAIFAAGICIRGKVADNACNASMYWFENGVCVRLTNDFVDKVEIVEPCESLHFLVYRIHAKIGTCLSTIAHLLSYANTVTKTY
ncbi:hypothetical protein AM500_06850 [Bacillus sp. FJAT-18017]|nr:hypothetical protein AM500_06850 [Bacillus sp. FJAT-18017]